jgi:dissimilatory sulfite reductase (desulfoviridin) alpha/beta subunit
VAIDYKALKNNGFMRQVQKNIFSLRLKVVGGNLTAAQLTVIAQTAEKYGGGTVHLTSRQGVEIPHIHLADVERVKEALAQGGVETGVCGARVRTVTACQGAAVCPAGCIETYALAKEISARYFGRTLPHKFKFGVTGCVNNCLKAEENDVGVKGGYAVAWQPEKCTLCGVCVPVCRQGALLQTDGKIQFDPTKCNHCGRCVKICPLGAWQGEAGYMLRCGGTFGNRIAQGEEILPILHSKDTLFAAADAALDFFDKYGVPGERLRVSIEREGWEKFKTHIRRAVQL